MRAHDLILHTRIKVTGDLSYPCPFGFPPPPGNLRVGAEEITGEVDAESFECGFGGFDTC